MSNKAKSFSIRKALTNGFSWNQAVQIAAAPAVVVKNATGIIYVPNQTANGATYAQAGVTVTVTTTAHNVPATVHDGFRVYSPGSASAVSCPGFPAGIYNNFQRTGATTYTFDLPANLTAAAGTGTMTTGVLTEFALADLTYTVPAGALGTNGKLRATAGIACNNSAGAKVIKVKLDTTNIVTASITTAVFGNVAQDILYNAGSAARQNIQSTGVASTIDTTLAKDITTTVTLANLQDYIAVMNVLVELIV